MIGWSRSDDVTINQSGTVFCASPYGSDGAATMTSPLTNRHSFPNELIKRLAWDVPAVESANNGPLAERKRRDPSRRDSIFRPIMATVMRFDDDDDDVHRRRVDE